ncbi:TetR/AcrR family transcriptional regulator [Speluncibacter jeojiensis]|uniref:TetR/AcrR family transcriptional regulator n=1 Tax=Speluncibacter jeojiensis TaxID=2710754 RepID=A0A9X4M1M7_9ACTN|nr:TetR/AcrR family transcriptional regulator [Corynebacteriales bacterium D3-21]
MPKIQAATVAEHRATQRRTLLDAARALLAEKPADPPTLAEVAARAGLARPSVYQYFASREDLFSVVLEEAFPRWSARVSTEMERAGGPGEKVLAYARANLELVAEGEHTLARSLAAFAAGGEFADRSRVLHQQLGTPLTQALTDLGAADPAVTAQLINAVVNAGSQLIESGATLDSTAARVRELLTPYLLGG